MSEETLESIRRYLSYNPETGIFNWIKKPLRSRVDIGDKAGYTNPLGYVVIGLLGKYYLGHRLAFWFMTGTEPVSELDHANGDPSDNRWSNIRGATRSQNLFNTRRDNKTGFRGVARKGSRFTARIRVSGKLEHLGTFDTPQEAHQAWLDAASKHQGDFRFKRAPRAA